MKKFKSNELLSRAEMKNVSGSAYGCGGVCTIIDNGPDEMSTVHYCQHSWSKGCGCPYGWRGSWIAC